MLKVQRKVCKSFLVVNIRFMAKGLLQACEVLHAIHAIITRNWRILNVIEVLCYVVIYIICRMEQWFFSQLNYKLYTACVLICDVFALWNCREIDDLKDMIYSMNQAIAIQTWEIDPDMETEKFSITLGKNHKRVSIFLSSSFVLLQRIIIPCKWFIARSLYSYDHKQSSVKITDWYSCFFFREEKAFVEKYTWLSRWTCRPWQPCYSYIWLLISKTTVLLLIAGLAFFLPPLLLEQKLT